jgi:hypothetical protein
MRGLVKRGTEASHIGPTEIIDQKEHDIGFRFFLGVKRKTSKQ